MANETKAIGIDSDYRTDQHKTSIGMPGGASPSSIASRDLHGKASDMADDPTHKSWDADDDSFMDKAKDKAKDAGDAIMHKASDVGYSMKEAGHDIAVKSRHSHQAVCSFARKNPTTAVLLAFGVGAIVARILPRR